MKRMEVSNMTSRWAIAALAAVSGAVHAQGYFDFSQVPGLGDVEPHVQIDLNPAMLSFVTAAAEASSPGAGEVLAGIRNVRVRVYDALEDAQAVLEFIEDSSGELERDGWQRIVYVQEEDKKIRVYLQLEEDRPVGLTVMVIDADSTEAVFINVAGEFDPVKLGQVARAVGIGEVLGEFTGVP